MLQNKKYIKFADQNTVEVMSLGGLDKGIEKGDRKAETYTEKVNGEEIEFLVEFPNLTVEEIYALNRGKAGSYNDTGKIPFTALIDPHTEKELQRWSGGIATGTIMDAVKEATRELRKQHGNGISRREIGQLAEAEAESREEIENGDFAEALEVLSKLSSSAQEWPQTMQERVSRAHRQVIEAAQKALAELEELALEEPEKAAREVAKLKLKLRGTGLEGRAQQLLLDLKG